MLRVPDALSGAIVWAVLCALAAPSARALVVPVNTSCNSCCGGCTSVINDAIAACAAAGRPCTVALAPGTFVLGGAPYGARVILRAARDIAFVGAGESTVLNVSDIANVFQVAGGSNVRRLRRM